MHPRISVTGRCWQSFRERRGVAGVATFGVCDGARWMNTVAAPGGAASQQSRYTHEKPARSCSSTHSGVWHSRTWPVPGCIRMVAPEQPVTVNVSSARNVNLVMGVLPFRGEIRAREGAKAV
jgi:hypothetical protein